MYSLSSTFVKVSIVQRQLTYIFDQESRDRGSNLPIFKCVVELKKKVLKTWVYFHLVITINTIIEILMWHDWVISFDLSWCDGIVDEGINKHVMLMPKRV